MSKKKPQGVIVVRNIFTGELGVTLKDQLDPASLIIADSGIYTRGYFPDWTSIGVMDDDAAETSVEIQTLQHIHFKHSSLENNIKRYLGTKRKEAKLLKTEATA